MPVTGLLRGSASRHVSARGSMLRGDIQGLRAVAVLVVVAGHAGLGLTGGYVGVDVFFVISGFLISQLLYREISRSGRLSIVRFYARRARRIVPAATLVTLVTLGASMLWISKVQAADVTYDALWVTLFAANIHFAANEADYFAEGQAMSPFQHYWSLSVEEQFYLVWPMLLIAAVLVPLRRRRSAGEPAAGLPRRPIGALLAGLTALSLAWSVWFTADDPQRAYFATTARAWELGIGALAALVGPRLLRGTSRRVRGVLCAVGLVAIGVACVAFDETTAMPGYAALLPVLGSALVLLSGTDPDSGTAPRPAPTNQALAWMPMQRIGDWSYSLYLWHWPLLWIPRLHFGRELGLATNLGLVAAAVALSAATYRWVETPFRTSPTMTARRSVGLYPATVAIVAVATFSCASYVAWAVGEHGNDPPVTMRNFGVPDESSYHLPTGHRRALVAASVIAARNHMALPSDLTPDLIDLRTSVPDVRDCEYSTEVRTLCPRGDPDGERTMVVLGNSHGRMWIPALDRIAEASGYTVYHLVRPHCPPAHFEVSPTETGDALVCAEFNSWAMDRVQELHPDLVVVATTPVSRSVGVRLDGEQRHDDASIEAATRVGFARLFAALDEHAERSVLIADVPQPHLDPAECLTLGDPDLGSCSFEPAQRDNRMRKAVMETATESGVDVVSVNRWICWNGTCPAVVGSTITYRDAGHLTIEYVTEMAPLLSGALGLRA